MFVKTDEEFWLDALYNDRMDIAAARNASYGNPDAVRAQVAAIETGMRAAEIALQHIRERDNLKPKTGEQT